MTFPQVTTAVVLPSLLTSLALGGILIALALSPISHCDRPDLPVDRETCLLAVHP